jgi:hypothetical protein
VSARVAERLRAVGNARALSAFEYCKISISQVYFRDLPLACDAGSGSGSGRGELTLVVTMVPSPEPDEPEAPPSPRASAEEAPVRETEHSPGAVDSDAATTPAPEEKQNLKQPRGLEVRSTHMHHATRPTPAPTRVSWASKT